MPAMITVMTIASTIPAIAIILFLFIKQTPLLMPAAQIKKSGISSCRSSYYNAM
jgi:hypothetical protein